MRRREHGDLAERVEAAEVDEDHVDDVAAVAVGHRPLDHLVGDRRRGRSTPAATSAKTNTIAADASPRCRCGRPADAGADCRLEAVGEAAQHEHEQDRRQRLDGDLGERQVGRAGRTNRPAIA